MSKKIVSLRLSEETIGEIDTLVVFLSSEKNLKLDRTKVIEMLIAEKYSEVTSE